MFENTSRSIYFLALAQYCSLVVDLEIRFRRRMFHYYTLGILASSPINL